MLYRLNPLSQCRAATRRLSTRLAGGTGTPVPGARGSAARCLLAAGLVFSAAAAMAADGYTVDLKQEAQIKAGMSQDEVRQIVGRPVRVEKFGNEPGPTWTYDVVGGLGHVAMFDIDFDADGRVASAQERIIDVD